MTAESTNYSEIEEVEGSWIPTIILSMVILTVWLGYGAGDIPVKWRRWYNIQVGFLSVDDFDVRNANLSLSILLPFVQDLVFGC